eukprot:6483365-Amphidinium_carterae.1
MTQRGAMSCFLLVGKDNTWGKVDWKGCESDTLGGRLVEAPHDNFVAIVDAKVVGVLYSRPAEIATEFYGARALVWADRLGGGAGE